MMEKKSGRYPWGSDEITLKAGDKIRFNITKHIGFTVTVLRIVDNEAKISFDRIPDLKATLYLEGMK